MQVELKCARCGAATVLATNISANLTCAACGCVDQISSVDIGTLCPDCGCRERMKKGDVFIQYGACCGKRRIILQSYDPGEHAVNDLLKTQGADPKTEKKKKVSVKKHKSAAKIESVEIDMNSSDAILEMVTVPLAKPSTRTK